MKKVYCGAKASSFFGKKIAVFLGIIHLKFNVSLTNDVVSFEKLGLYHLFFNCDPEDWYYSA